MLFIGKMRSDFLEILKETSSEAIDGDDFSIG